MILTVNSDYLAAQDGAVDLKGYSYGLTLFRVSSLGISWAGYATF